jgi:hypothetical protein
MIRVWKKKVDENTAKKHNLEPNKEYFVMNFSRGSVYTETYPDRTLYTKDRFLQKCYYLDDIRYFFTANNFDEFVKYRDDLAEQIIEFVEEIIQVQKQYPSNSQSWFVYERRINVFRDWAEDIINTKPKTRKPIQNSIRTLRRKRLKLK